MLHKLANTIRAELDSLVEQYDARLANRPGYNQLPELRRRDLERQILNVIADALIKGDSQELVDHVRQRASQWVGAGLEVVWFQESLTVPEEILVPLIDSVAASTFLWQALNRGQAAVWQMVADRAHTAEQNLRQSQQLLQTVMNNIPQAVFWKDQNLTYLGCNRAFAEDAGLASPAEIAGKTDYDMPWQPQAELYRADDRLVIDSGTAKINYEEPQTTPTGDQTWLRTSKVPMRDAAGNVTAVLGMYEDITQRKESEMALARERNLLRTLIDNLPDQVFFKDAQGHIMLYNGADAHAMGITSTEEALGKTVYDLYPTELADRYHADDMAVIQSGQPLINREEPGIDEFGQTRWILTTKVPLKDEQGHALGLIGVARDITQRKQIESSLQQSEDRFRRFSEATVEGLAFHEDGVILDANPAVVKLFGFTAVADLVGRNLLEFIVPESQALVVQKMQLEDVHPYEIQCIRQDGTTFPVETSTRTYEYEGRKVRASSVRDITVRKKLEQSIRDSLERRGRQVEVTRQVSQEIAMASNVEAIFPLVVTLIKERFNYYHAQIFRYETALDAVVLVAGYGEAGQHMLAAQHQLPMGHGVVGTAAQTGHSILAADVMQDPDWKPNPYLPDTKGELAVPIKLRDQVLGILDVQSDRAGALTDEDRLLVEGLCGQIAIAMESARLFDELRSNEVQLSQALKIAKLAYWEYDVEKDLFQFNDQFFSIFHTRAEQHGGYRLSSAYYAQHFVHPDDLVIVGTEIEKALNSTDRHYNRLLEHRILYADGGLGYISVNINIDRDEQGKILRYYGANQDITDRKLAEAELKETEERFRIIAETTPIPILISALADGSVLYGNDQLGQMFGLPIAQLIGRPTPDFYFDPADRQALLTGLRQAGSLRDYELHVKHADGTPFWVLVSMRTLLFANQPALFAAFLDITASRQAAEELRRSQAQLSQALEIAKLAYWEYDVEKDLFLFNDQFYSIFHTTAAQHGGYQLSSAYYAQHFVHPDDLALVGTEIERALNSIDRHYHRRLEHRILYADGGVGYITVDVNIDRDEQGHILRYYGANQDVTDSKLAEVERERLLAEQQRRAVQLQTAAEVGRVATSILNPDQLLSEIVDLIAKRFSLYHAGVFTIDDSGRWAVLREATGEAGRQLKERGQALAIRGQSAVGGAIRRRQPQIALDVGPAAVQFNDPLLPNTRSEIALPLFVGDRVLGALDLHSTAPAAFDDNSAVLMQGMADQIAVALNTAEQYQREQAHLDQTRRLLQIVIDLSEQTERAGLQDQLVRSALVLLDTDRSQFWLQETGGLELKAVHSARTGADQSLAISQELAERVRSSSLSLRLDSPPVQAGYASRITDVPFNAALITPISWQGRTVGVLSVMRSQPGRPFTQDDETAAQLLAAQAATALENITLAEQQQRRALQLQTAADVSRATSSILNLDELLPYAAETVRARFNLYYVGIFLNDEAGQWAVLRAGTGDAGQRMLADGHRLKIGETSMISQCIVNQQAQIALDVGAEAIRFDNPHLPLTHSELALPLASRGHITGAVTIQSDQPAAFSPDDIAVLQTMADQIGNAIENARLYDQSSAALREVDALNRRLTGEGWETYLSRGSSQPVLWAGDDEAIAPTALTTVDDQLSSGQIVIEPAADGEPATTVSVPVRLRGQTIGALRVTMSEDDYTDELRVTLESLAGHVAQAAENARLLDETQARFARERALGEATDRIRRRPEVEHVLQATAEELARYLQASAISVRLGSRPTLAGEIGQPVEPNVETAFTAEES